MSNVKLYVYDLSRGMARSMSMQFVGRQIDGIWHTSIVVFGMEVFYGQGILITAPGKSHHGNPLEMIDMGETAIDKDTFQEYLTQMREHYTADKYHLLEFNCNSFTNDCIGFLTGGQIPAHIRDLPSDFLQSPLGAALRPTIDSMFRPPGSVTPTPSAIANPSPSSSFSGAPAASASRPITNGSSTLTAPIQISTNPSSLKTIITRRKAVAVFFTSATCAPCKIVEPIFEDLAYSKSSAGVAFVKVDLGVGQGQAAASEHGVPATPTFLFFVDGQKTAEVKGADMQELRTNVDLMIFQSFPPHPHTRIELPAVRAISLQPILIKSMPNIDKAESMMLASIDKSQASFDKAACRKTLSTSFIPVLRHAANAKSNDHSVDVNSWIALTTTLASHLPPAELFPLVDFWRIGLLESKITQKLNPSSGEPFRTLLTKGTEAIAVTDSKQPSPRNFFVTLLRMLSNGFAAPQVADQLMKTNLKMQMIRFLIPCLLHEASVVRIAAAGLSFNIAAYHQGPVLAFHKDGVRGNPAPDEAGGGDWEVELTSAILEAVGQEKESEESLHRLTAALALILYLSSHYDDQLVSLLEVLQAKEVLLSKLEKKDFGGDGIVQKDIRKLVEEVAGKHCP